MVMGVVLTACKLLLRGWMGELRVRLAGWLWLRRRGFVGLHDVMNEVGRGTMQVDHLYVGRTGVFVVETKNMTGRFFGKVGEEP